MTKLKEYLRAKGATHVSWMRRCSVNGILNIVWSMWEYYELQKICTC